MRISHLRENVLEGPSILIQGGWDEHLARWISLVGSPPLMTVAGVVLAALTLATLSVWPWIVIYSLLVIFLPLLYLVWLFRGGRVADLDLRIREQRTRPLLITLAGAILAWILLYFGSAPNLLVTLACASGLQTALFLGITLRWKISAHCTSAAGLTTLAWALASSMAIPLVISLLLIAWSRIRLGHHTLTQTIAGAALGSSVLIVALLVYGG